MVVRTLKQRVISNSRSRLSCFIRQFRSVNWTPPLRRVWKKCIEERTAERRSQPAKTHNALPAPPPSLRLTTAPATFSSRLTALCRSCVARYIEVFIEYTAGNVMSAGQVGVTTFSAFYQYHFSNVDLERYKQSTPRRRQLAPPSRAERGDKCRRAGNTRGLASPWGQSPRNRNAAASLPESIASFDDFLDTEVIRLQSLDPSPRVIGLSARPQPEVSSSPDARHQHHRILQPTTPEERELSSYSVPACARGITGSDMPVESALVYLSLESCSPALTCSNTIHRQTLGGNPRTLTLLGEDMADRGHAPQVSTNAGALTRKRSFGERIPDPPRRRSMQSPLPAACYARPSAGGCGGGVQPVSLELGGEIRQLCSPTAISTPPLPASLALHF